MKIRIFLLSITWSLTFTSQAQNTQKFTFDDVFQLEYASSPTISPDGKKVVYVRNANDIMVDRTRSNLWIADLEADDSRPLTTGNHNDFSPIWSADGQKLYYLSNESGRTQLYVRWMDTGQTAKLTNLTASASGLSLSPNGTWIAFSMSVEEKPKSLIALPAKPKGAKWAAPAKYIDKLKYKADGGGFIKPGYRHIFLLSTDGGTPRQLTSGDYHHGGKLSWTQDSKNILFSANRRDDWEYEPNDTEIFSISVNDGKLTKLTKDRLGPDSYPILSRDGKKLAYLGFDDEYQGYQVTNLYVANADGSAPKQLVSGLDRSIQSPRWSADGKGIYFQYDDHGNTKISYVTLAGKRQQLTGDVGGLSIGRPYSGGSFSVANNGNIAFTLGTTTHPADIAVIGKDGKVKRITELNKDLFGYKQLGKVAEVKFNSSHDQREIQGWFITPPDFDPTKKYPLILEIHGGPFANYGDRFAAELQLFAAAGYVVLYTNPRGSTSYGAEFGNLIHHNYPGQDYDDLMSGVDAMVKKGFIDEEKLYVTGGSGGGVLTAWIIGNTDKFKAAVVAKPVINWFSFALTADAYNFFYRYWFPGLPWEHAEHYMKRSPISLIGNVKTPTMLLTGEQDFRTPMSETEQYYQALKLQKVESAMVRIQGAGHGIAARPSNLITKVAYILKWFDMH